MRAEARGRQGRGSEIECQGGKGTESGVRVKEAQNIPATLHNSVAEDIKGRYYFALSSY